MGDRSHGQSSDKSFSVWQPEISLPVQWLRLYTANAGSTGLIPDQVTKTPRSVQHGQKKKKKKKWFGNLGKESTRCNLEHEMIGIPRRVLIPREEEPGLQS